MSLFSEMALVYKPFQLVIHYLLLKLHRQNFEAPSHPQHRFHPDSSCVARNMITIDQHNIQPGMPTNMIMKVVGDCER